MFNATGSKTVTAECGDTLTANVVVISAMISAASFVSLNDNWDEQNHDAVGSKVADNAPDSVAGNRIVATDVDLADVSLSLNGAAQATGRWKLVFPDKVKVWQSNGGAFTPVVSDVESDPMSLTQAISLKVEGISPSAAVDDVALSATFVLTDQGITLRANALQLNIRNYSR